MVPFDFFLFLPHDITYDDMLPLGVMIHSSNSIFSWLSPKRPPQTTQKQTNSIPHSFILSSSYFPLLISFHMLILSPSHQSHDFHFYDFFYFTNRKSSSSHQPLHRLEGHPQQPRHQLPHPPPTLPRHPQ